MRELGIGLIGTGFMGRAHALAFNNARAVFELPFTLKLAALADADTERARRCATAWGFAQAHGDWQALINDPTVDVVAITTPNHLHYPMAMAAIATAWSGFESSSWGSVQSSFTAQSSAKRIEANRKATEAGQLRTLDVITFTEWIGAVNLETHADPSAFPAQGYVPRERTGSGFLYARFRSEFRPVFDAWLAQQPLRNPAAASTPFVMPEYRLTAQDQADALSDEAERLTLKAQEASMLASRYVLMSVLFALVLFCVAVGNKASGRRSRILLFGLSALTLLASLIALATFPVVI